MAEMAWVLVRGTHLHFRKFPVQVDSGQKFRDVAEFGHKGLGRFQEFRVLFLEKQRVFLEYRAASRRIRDDRIKTALLKDLDVTFCEVTGDAANAGVDVERPTAT